MARALECPACGARHRIEALPDAPTFRCDRCGQVLKVPAPVSSSGAASAPSGAPASAPAPIAPPPRRRDPAVQNGPASGAATSAPPVRTAAAVSATVAAAPPAEATADGEGRRARRAGKSSGSRQKVSWYWRLLAWIVAVPVGFVITAWPANALGLIERDDVLDIFVGTGSGRYVRLAIATAVWALVTALLVQLMVEGGRAVGGAPKGAGGAGVTTRFRCSACGNLTRFDVIASRRTRAFHHFSVAGELSVEDEEVLDETLETVTCRWCGASGESIEALALDT